MRQIHGIAASRGIAIGPTYRLGRPQFACTRYIVDNPAREWERFQAALQVARQQLEQIAEHTRQRSGDEYAAIFQAQLLMLDDPALLRHVREAIESRHLNAEAALLDAIESQTQLLETLEDEYLRARTADVRDVAQRVLHALIGAPECRLEMPAWPVIALAEDLSPSDVALLDPARVLGFCTAKGGLTGHTVILARALGLPTVVGAGPGVLSIPDGTQVVLDGSAGILVVEPDERTIAAYRQRQVFLSSLLEQAILRAHEPAVTVDGEVVTVLANIGDVASARAAIEAGAEGAGLVRTEFLYLGRSQPPDEEEQARAYTEILETFGTLPVILRVVDIGGDKRPPYLNLTLEPNPALGLRGIRLCLAQPDLLKMQLRAMLRAAAGRRLKVMLPMVTDVGEIRTVRTLLEQIQTEHTMSGWACPTLVELGAMIETPAAALLADRLAPLVDFLSIGTNDLAQYTLAADRASTNVSTLADGLHPAVLRLVNSVLKEAGAHCKPVSLCGELAGEPFAIPILIGLGLRTFSVNVPAIALTKAIIRSIQATDAQQLAQEALLMENAEAVRRLAQTHMPVLADIG